MTEILQVNSLEGQEECQQAEGLVGGREWKGRGGASSPFPLPPSMASQPALALPLWSFVASPVGLASGSSLTSVVLGVWAGDYLGTLGLRALSGTGGRDARGGPCVTCL